jgi:hypothetical protein
MTSSTAAWVTPGRQRRTRYRWCKRNPLVASLSAVAIASLIIVTCVSTWSAMTLSAKNMLLAEETARANLNAENEEKQAELAKANEAKAKEQAENLQKYVQSFINQVRGVEVIDTPQLRPFRESQTRFRQKGRQLGKTRRRPKVP